MIAHQSPISGVAAYDGRFIATAGYDNQIILWDAANKIALARVWHDHLANQLEFSPDGQYLVSASSDTSARLWSVPSMKLLAVMSDHGDDVEMAIFHPSQSLIATASRDHQVRVFNFEGRLICRFQGHTADVISIAWNTAGDGLISSSDDGTLKHWSLHTQTLVSDIDLGGIETDTIAIAQDGRIYAGNDVGQIITLSASGTERMPAHDSGIKRLIYQDSDQLLVSLSYDRFLKIWQCSAGRIDLIAQSAIPAQIWPRSCAFLDSNTLVFATFGSSYASFDIASGQWDLRQVDPTQGVNAVIAHPAGRMTIGDAGTLRINGRASSETGSLCNFLTAAGGQVFTGGQTGELFNARTGQGIYQHKSPLNCGTAFMRHGVAHVLIGTYTGEGLVFAVSKEGATALVGTLQLHENAVKAVAASNSLIFSVCADTSAAWFSIQDLREKARKKQAHGRIANGCAALPGDRFISISRDRQLRIWEDFSVTTVPTPHSHSIKCVAASTDGRFIASGSYGGCVAIYDTHHQHWLPCERPTASGISSLCFDAAAAQFLAGSYDGQIYQISSAPLPSI
ncbi:WD40 repeat domain-containing protein [Comamonas koreensis]|uniref:WD40 repeat domain-containing protein n=1 Tax=Comamonas koreensis TaxID=160825 RepID=A0AAW4XRV3_9BURK|nr:WD40 repeat domain-containing protein [Comamonas koreensis]MCD2164111.1 WD40 repeat domain-containing protein [Comamonas koreensis]